MIDIFNFQENDFNKSNNFEFSQNPLKKQSSLCDILSLGDDCLNINYSSYYNKPINYMEIQNMAAGEKNDDESIIGMTMESTESENILQNPRKFSINTSGYLEEENSFGKISEDQCSSNTTENISEDQCSNTTENICEDQCSNTTENFFKYSPTKQIKKINKYIEDKSNYMCLSKNFQVIVGSFFRKYIKNLATTKKNKFFILDSKNYYQKLKALSEILNGGKWKYRKLASFKSYQELGKLKKLGNFALNKLISYLENYCLLEISEYLYEKRNCEKLEILCMKKLQSFTKFIKSLSKSVTKSYTRFC